MHIVTVTRHIAAPAQKVWRMAGNFGGLRAWSRAVVDCTLEGDGVGCHRTITTAGGTVLERLDALDPAAMRLVYTPVSGSSLPVTGLRATLQLFAVPEGTRVEWRLDGEPQGSPAEVAALLKTRYAARLKELDEASLNLPTDQDNA